MEGGAAGEQLAEWMTRGSPSVDMRRFDPRRFGADLQRAHAYAMVAESYTFGYAIAYPHVERQAGRPVKTSPIHDRLAGRSARFGARNGWECPLYFGNIDHSEDLPSYQRRRWFSSVGRECRAVRDGVGILDLASLAKYCVTGPNAAALLDRLFATPLPVTDGTAVEALMLTTRGGIGGRMRVLRVSDEHYYLTAPTEAEAHHLDCLRRAADGIGQVAIENVSGRMATLLIAGPQSRPLLADLSHVDLSAGAWPLGALRTLRMGMIETRVLRVHAHGELGYELHHGAEYHAGLYAVLLDAGTALQVMDFGFKAWESMGLEAHYPHWRRDITEEDSPLDAGLDHVLPIKAADFIGRDALLRRCHRGGRRRLVCLAIEGSGVDPWGDEVVLDGETPVALLRSAGYGHRVGKPLGLAYLPLRLAVSGTRVMVEILGQRCPAVVLQSPLYNAPDAIM